MLRYLLYVMINGGGKYSRTDLGRWKLNNIDKIIKNDYVNYDNCFTSLRYHK